MASGIRCHSTSESGQLGCNEEVIRLVYFLENVFESAIVLLQDSVFGGQELKQL